MFEHGVVEVAPEGFAELEAGASDRHVVTLCTEGRSFFAAVTEATGIPLIQNWDGLADLLFDYANERPEGVVVFWHCSREFRLDSPQDYRIAVGVLAGLPITSFIARNDLTWYEVVTVEGHESTGVVVGFADDGSSYTVSIGGTTHQLARHQLEPTGEQVSRESVCGEEEMSLLTWEEWRSVTSELVVEGLAGPVPATRFVAACTGLGEMPAVFAEVTALMMEAGLVELGGGTIARAVEEPESCWFTNTPFADALARLVRATGRPTDLTDHHSRYWLYQTARDQLDQPDKLDLLHAAMALEPAPVLLQSVVLRVMLLDTDDHEPWLKLVPGDEYTACRSREIKVLRRATELTEDDLAGLTDWTNWLQLKLAEVPEPRLLRALMDNGRTKRIRRNAFATLRALDY